MKFHVLKYTLCYIFRCSSRDMHNVNAYRATHVCLSPGFSSRTAGLTWLGFGTNILPVGYTLELYLFSSLQSLIYENVGETNL